MAGTVRTPLPPPYPGDQAHPLVAALSIFAPGITVAPRLTVAPGITGAAGATAAEPEDASERLSHHVTALRWARRGVA